jgi:uncharacterized ubiquitin-like protein YukD
MRLNLLGIDIVLCFIYGMEKIYVLKWETLTIKQAQTEKRKMRLDRKPTLLLAPEE